MSHRSSKAALQDWWSNPSTWAYATNSCTLQILFFSPSGVPFQLDRNAGNAVMRSNCNGTRTLENLVVKYRNGRNADEHDQWMCTPINSRPESNLEVQILTPISETRDREKYLETRQYLHTDCGDVFRYASRAGPLQ